MKVWTNSHFNISVRPLLEQLKRLEPLLRRTRAVLVLAYRMVSAMLAHMHAWRPRRYFIIYHHGHSTDIILYEDIDGKTQKETMRTVKHIHDIDATLKEMAHLSPAPLLYQPSSVPITVVTQCPECEMKTFDLSKVPFWKRWEVVRRMGEALIQPEGRNIATWIQKAFIRQTQYDVSGVKVVSRHVWFGVLKANASVAALEDWLQRQKRPVIAAKWAPLMLAEYLWRTIDNTAPWTILLCPFEGEGFQLFVYHHRTLVLYRQGFINTFTEGSLREEVQQTMRYAERLGYLPSTMFRVISYGFEPTNHMITPNSEWHYHDMPEQKQWLSSPPPSWAQAWRNFFQRPTLGEAELAPTRFISSWMAYHLPRWLCVSIVPFIHFAFWSVIVLWMKSSYLSHTIHTLEPLMAEQQTQQSHLAGRVLHASCFETFLSVYAHQPTTLLQRVTPLLGQVGVIQRIHYEGGKQGEHQTINFFFPNKMTKPALAHIKKCLGEDSFNVESTIQGSLNTLQITRR